MILERPNNSISQYTLKAPVIDGKLTNYARYILLFQEHETLSKREILMLGTGTDYDAVPVTKRRGFLSTPIAMLSQNKIITFNRSTKKWSKGENYDEYVNTYLKQFKGAPLI